MKSRFMLKDNVCNCHPEKERPTVVGDGWISVEDQLPEDGDKILVVTNGYVDSCYYQHGSFVNDQVTGGEASLEYLTSITHWQEFPNPPKGAVE